MHRGMLGVNAHILAPGAAVVVVAGGAEAAQCGALIAELAILLQRPQYSVSRWWKPPPLRQSFSFKHQLPDPNTCLYDAQY